MDTKATPLELVIQLISSAELGAGVFGNDPDVFRAFGVEHGVQIKKANAKVYLNSLEQLYESNREIYSSYSLQHFEKSVLKLIHPPLTGGPMPTQKDVSAFLQGLVSVPLEKHAVYRPIFGIEFEGTSPVTLGPFRVFSRQAHAAELSADMAETLEVSDFYLEVPYLIRCSVVARESTKALELADARFESFERVVRFMIGPNENFEIGILNFRGSKQRQSIVLSNQSGTSSSGIDKFTQMLPIDEPHFVSSTSGFTRVWALLSSSSRNEIENRLLLAIEWIGQSLTERVPSSAFLKAAIALEILFTPQKSDYITPSIASQISESIAMVIGHDAESRHEIESIVKKLYGLRSGIAHAGKTDVRQQDLANIQHLARNVVLRLLTSATLRPAKTAVEMQKLFKTMKYSCPAIT